MQVDLLVVLDGKVLPSAFEVRHLHEVPRGHRLAYVGVVVLVLERGADQLDVHARADADLRGSSRVEAAAAGWSS